MQNEIVLVVPVVPAVTKDVPKDHIHRQSDTKIKIDARVMGNKLSFFAEHHSDVDADVTSQPSCCPWLCGQ